MARFPDCPAAWDIFLAPSSHALQNAGRGGGRHAANPASAVGDSEIAVLDLHLRMGLAAQLTHCFDDFCHAAAVDRVIAAQPAAVGVERQLSDAGNQIAVGDELAALALLAEAEVFDLHQYRDGEAVIDRGIFDVLWRDAGLLERPRAGPDPGGISEIEILAAARSLHRFAVPDQAHQRLFQAFGDFRLGHDQRAAAVTYDAAVEPMQRIGNHRRIEHVLDGDDLAQHGVG